MTRPNFHFVAWSVSSATFMSPDFWKKIKKTYQTLLKKWSVRDKSAVVIFKVFCEHSGHFLIFQNMNIHLCSWIKRTNKIKFLTSGTILQEKFGDKERHF